MSQIDGLIFYCYQSIFDSKQGGVMGWSKVGGSSFDGNGDEGVFCDNESSLNNSLYVFFAVICM